MFQLRHGLLFVVIVAALSTAVATMAAEETTISGAGATFPYPVYAKWADAYAKETNVKLNYQAIGSGGGIKQITEGTVDFGASDAPLKPEELDKAGLVQFPVVMGGVVPVINIAGIKAGELKLTPDLLAQILLGHIKKWNDPKIAAANPGLKLPDTAITVVHRSDGSGTTWIFTNYLTKVSPDWAKAVGNDKSVAWPTGVGGKGNQGVASYVQRINGDNFADLVVIGTDSATSNRRTPGRTTSRMPSSRTATARSSTRPTTACKPPPRAPTGRTRTATTWS